MDEAEARCLLGIYELSLGEPGGSTFTPRIHKAGAALVARMEIDADKSAEGV